MGKDSTGLFDDIVSSNKYILDKNSNFQGDTKAYLNEIHQENIAVINSRKQHVVVDAKMERKELLRQKQLELLKKQQEN